MVLNNRAFHRAKLFSIPENIGFIFLPPCNFELNTSENIWAILKIKFTEKLYNTKEKGSRFIREATKSLCADKIKSTYRFAYILLGLNWSI